MIGELVIGSCAVAAGGMTYARKRRGKLYRELEGRVARIPTGQAPDLRAWLDRARPDFADRLAVVQNLLPPPTFTALLDEAERLVSPERSFVPTHKKGGTVAYETLVATAPTIVGFYHSREFMDFISRVVGVRIVTTPIYDQSSLSVLCYEKPGDHIGWHFDHNFYRGRHFTVLIALSNQGQADGGLSHAELQARAGGREMAIPTAANTLVVFEGAQVLHKVTPLREGERRVVLSMTYCADPRAWWWQGIARRLKDTAFYGVRALWT